VVIIGDAFNMAFKNLAQFLASIITYYATFGMVYPKHDLTLNKFIILRVEQKTTKVNAQVKVL
jgi:hypothetical protein